MARKTTFTRGLVLAAALIGGSIGLTVGGCAGPSRRETKEQVVARLARYDDLVRKQRAQFSDAMYRRLDAKYHDSLATGKPFTYDVLALSAGGQYGAFGVGVLQGWGSESLKHGPDAMPRFDVVTGVSTGALIAPFAFLDTAESISRIDRIYQEIDDRFVVLRDLLFFLPWRVSFYDSAPLAKRLEAEIHHELIERIKVEADRDRLLLIGTTDVDLGRMRVWNLGDLAGGGENEPDAVRFRKVLLASAAIPAAFPPVELDGSLFVDGGVTQQAIIGLDREQIEEVVHRFIEANPGAMMPHLRFWLIVNGSLDAPPEVVPFDWVTVSSRSIDTMMKYSMRTTLRHIEFGVETLSQRLGAKVDFRYMCVPDSFPLPETKDLFERKLMDALAAKGREMGKDPSNWRTSVASVELPNGDSTHAPK
jgi:predicted acylesterase/phospholipase RssA